jgi:hypothetical protein
VLHFELPALRVKRGQKEKSLIFFPSYKLSGTDKVAMYFPRIVQCFCLSLAMASTVSLAQEEPPSPGSDIEPITTVNPDIPLDELALLVKPLTAEELKVEAEAWMSLLRDKTRETSQAEGGQRTGSGGQGFG